MAHDDEEMTVPEDETRPVTGRGARSGRVRNGRSGRRLRWIAGVAATMTVVVSTAALTVGTASAATNPYQRGPDPTLASVSASRGTFPTAQVNVPAGNGFKAGVIYYPTDDSHTYGGIAIVPGYTAKFAKEEAWMGPWLASFGFVVIGIDTNSPNDYDTARGTQLLAALDYLTQKSSVRSRVDPNRLAVVGHSMGGGGAMVAAERRPSLKAAVGLAPFMPSGNLSSDKVPTMVIAGSKDPTVSASSVLSLYNSAPSSTERAYLEFSGANHLTYTKPYTLEMRILIPWYKIWLDKDTRYTQFLCPSLKDSTGVRTYRDTCPFTP